MAGAKSHPWGGDLPEQFTDDDLRQGDDPGARIRLRPTGERAPPVLIPEIDSSIFAVRAVRSSL
jgi:hypothetical protein